jgi:hypothetical protein
MDSPEQTGRYACANCGNARSFIGYDDRGYPGPDECDCEKDVCVCEITLKQYFTVHADGCISYQAFEGGGFGAEIGSYTRIQCAVCTAFVWQENAQPPQRIPKRKEKPTA